MGFHVALYGVCLFGAIEGDREFEDAAGDLRAAEVAQLGFKVEKVGKEVLLGDMEAVVVD